MSAVMSGPDGRGGANSRALTFAVLGSLVFHAALLFLVSLDRQMRRESASPGPIVARLVAPPAVPAPSPQPVEPLESKPPKPHAEPKHAPKPEPKPVAKPAPVRKPSPIPAVPRTEPALPEPARSAPVQPVPDSPAMQVAPGPAPAPSAPAVAKVDPAPTAPAPPSPDAGTLETYRMDLMRMARNYKRYPRVALDNNWEGRAVVRLVIGANGMTSSLTVISSAGHAVLDKQAVDMIQKAKPRVLIPPALRGREFSIDIPVIYDLKDQAAG